jgi:hypothetical protein
MPTLHDIVKDDLYGAEDEVVDDYEIIAPKMEDEAILTIRLFMQSGKVFVLRHKVCESLMP